ncbi:Protein DA1-related 2 -like protein [Gossypium arboreum]|uniref:Protein DA1-related 2-like protein n=1 Tax=Gossypium arboreum TaxID=29729 RepID=A0A0B0MDP7_GOSAR|nr:Protein DA1-related 2 -like protein [Gossypium arboreum]
MSHILISDYVEFQIPTNGAGLIEYRCHPFWSQKYCPSHEHDNTARCCSCERLESWNVRYYSLEDGRSLCLECMESAIMDTGDCQPLYHAIRDYYEGMYMKLDQQIPMLLVERQALNEAIVGEKNGYHHMPETRGLCLSEEQTVTSILKRPRIGGRQLIGMRTQPQKLTRKCEVTAILVLYGLPRLLTGAILAHELMHGWLRLKGYRNLNPEVEEGICQVLSYMWLESEVLPGPSSRASTSAASSSSSSSKKGGRSNVENKLGEFFIHQIAHDASPAYGGGFRAANAAVNKYGLRQTLDHIRLTGEFPVVKT